MKNEEVISAIRSCIREKGMVQGIVAERAGFTQKQFSDMLHGRKTIMAEYMPDIAKALGVSINKIYGWNEEKAS